jgi:hypothetical protein
MRTKAPADVAAEVAPDDLEILGPATDRGSGNVLHGSVGGAAVLVRRLPAGPDARARAHADFLARRLLDVEHPALVAVRAVQSDWRQLDIVYDAPQVELSLAALGTERRLTAGEVVTVGRALADALLHLQRAGLCHGRLTAADVLVRPDGSVGLTGYGVAAILGSAGSADDDVRDLIALLLLSLEDDTSAGLRRALESLVRDDEGRVEVLLDVLEAVQVLPTRIRLANQVGGLPVPRPPRRAFRAQPLWGRGQRLLPARAGWGFLGGILPAALGVLLLAGWIGASLGPPAPDESVTAQPTRGPAAPEAAPRATASPTPAPAPTGTAAATAAPGPSSTDWRSVLTELNRRRTAVLAAADERQLSTVDAVGSSAYASDVALVRALAARRAVGRDVRTDVVSVSVRSAGADRADLTVVDVLRPYTIVAVSGPQRGSVLEQRLGRSARTTVLVLVRVADSWRVAQAQPG